jgi:adenylate kinase family enzyme
VVGSSGAGKSTVGSALAERLGIEYIELDGVFHQAGWRDLPVEEFQRRIEVVTGASAWVVDGNYGAVREIVWRRAQLVVWLDLPRWLVVLRVVRRSVVRCLTRRELWNGNREEWRNLISHDPQRSVIVATWKFHSAVRLRYEAAMNDPAYSGLTFVRLRTSRQIDSFVANGLPDVGKGLVTG